MKVLSPMEATQWAGPHGTTPPVWPEGSTMNSQTIIESVTTRIIEQLQTGVKPWECVWNRAGGGGMFDLPRNPSTKEDYHGINIPILWDAASRLGYSTHQWLGYGQARELGGQVRKGEKGTHGIIYKPLVVEDEEAEDGTRTIPMLRSFVVFNLDQIDGLEHLRAPVPPEGPTFAPIEAAEDLLRRSGARIEEGGTRAFYRRADDGIRLPDRFRFQTAEDFYATGLHELTHWTGHESRLDRTWGKRFGDQAYAFEELVAEMGSAFLCTKLKLDGELQHASYIDGWLQILKQDARALLRAASQAQKAYEFIHALMGEPVVEETVPA